MDDVLVKKNRMEKLFIKSKYVCNSYIRIKIILTSESQNIEFKSNWRDEYLKWICGFANANGGTIYIGKDDIGTVVNLIDAKKLLEEIPNKVRDILGILVEVNLH